MYVVKGISLIVLLVSIQKELLCCRVNLYSFVPKLGMVERMNRSIKDVMKSCWKVKEIGKICCLWYCSLLELQGTAALGPFRLMFQHDPIYPFEFMDRLKHDGDETVNASISELRADEMFEKMERLRIEYNSAGSENKRETENRAMKEIKQSQERMSKYYNLQNAGVKFKVSDKVLKRI